MSEYFFFPFVLPLSFISFSLVVLLPPAMVSQGRCEPKMAGHHLAPLSGVSEVQT